MHLEAVQSEKPHLGRESCALRLCSLCEGYRTAQRRLDREAPADRDVLHDELLELSIHLGPQTPRNPDVRSAVEMGGAIISIEVRNSE